ncbi:MAG: hypothetical protein KA354_14335 [Phycisphaerae bacterium]|nr:hypothetical protein [Phycisphaerae bacterium]
MIDGHACELQTAITQRLEALPARLSECLTQISAEHWTAIGSQLAEAALTANRQAALRPVIDQSLALLDRIHDEGEFLATGYHRNPELALHLGSRQLFETYDAAVRSFVTEIFMILRTLDVHPIQGSAGPFNPQLQRVVGVERTSKPELDGHVARIVRVGVTWNGAVFRHEQVIVFKKEC